jgi:hypothetical protein
MEQLKVDMNDLPLVMKKKVAAATASVPSTEAFPMMGLARQLEVPTVAAASIRGQKVGEECRKSGLDGRLEAMAASFHLKAMVDSIYLDATAAATSEAARLRETLPTASWVVGPYENTAT